MSQCGEQINRNKNNDEVQSKGGRNIDLREQLLLERERLNLLHSKATNNLVDSPKGTLRLGKSQGCIQYLHYREDTGPNGEYIHKNNMELARKLAQKSYDEKIKKLTTKRLRQVDAILKDFSKDEILEVFLSEHPERQKLIVPVEETYEQKLNRWLSQPYTGKGFAEDMVVITTDNGLRVRSKSERFMADYFDSIGIKYKYECPLILKPYGVVFPDFTFLSQRTGKEIFWEHEGMLDNPEYAQTAAKKIELYEKNGIFPGENLILTFETATHILDKKILEMLVQRYL